MIDLEYALEMLIFGLVGLAGGLTLLFLMPKVPGETWLWIRRSWLGFVAGAIYHYFAVQLGMPNGIASFTMGATAQAFLESLILRKGKIEIPHKKLILQDPEEGND